MKKTVTIENLSFAYGREPILKEVNIAFPEAQLSVIMGRNGSGKSTLFNVIAGLEKKYEGKVWIGNEERKNCKPGKSEMRVGFLNQFHQTTFPFTVFDVVLTGRASFSRLTPTKCDREAVVEILDRFRLSHLKEKAYTSLSGGERQLVLLCRVLVQQPDILMLDEPTNHLDLHYQVAVLECLQQLVKEGTTVLCVMHDPNLAFMYGDRFYVMQDCELLDLHAHDPTQVKHLLETTYRLPLATLEHQGKKLFVPKLK